MRKWMTLLFAAALALVLAAARGEGMLATEMKAQIPAAVEGDPDALGYQKEKGWKILLIDAQTGKMVDPEEETAGRWVYAPTR